MIAGVYKEDMAIATGSQSPNHFIVWSDLMVNF